MIDCNEWRTEKRHECANMGKVIRLELWWQLYRTSLPVWDLENFRPMDFCWHECTHSRMLNRENGNESVKEETTLLLRVLRVPHSPCGNTFRDKCQGDKCQTHRVTLVAQCSSRNSLHIKEEASIHYAAFSWLISPCSNFLASFLKLKAGYSHIQMTYWVKVKEI